MPCKGSPFTPFNKLIKFEVLKQIFMKINDNYPRIENRIILFSIMAGSQKIKSWIIIWSSNSTSVNIPKELKSRTLVASYTPIFIATLLTVAKR